MIGFFIFGVSRTAVIPGLYPLVPENLRLSIGPATVFSCSICRIDIGYSYGGNIPCFLNVAFLWNRLTQPRPGVVISTGKNPGQYNPAIVLSLKCMYESIASSNAAVFVLENFLANIIPRLENPSMISHSSMVRKCVCVWNPALFSHSPSSQVFH